MTKSFEELVSELRNNTEKRVRLHKDNLLDLTLYIRSNATDPTNLAMEMTDRDYELYVLNKEANELFYQIVNLEEPIEDESN